MEIIEVKISELKPAEYNPRSLTEKEKNDIKTSIERFGMVEPIVVNEAPERKNVIIGGHQRYYICRELGRETIPVVFVNIPDIAKEQELNLRLNKNLGHWDWGLLANFDEKMLLDVGFEEIELDQGFDLGIFDSANYEFDYPFGTINSFIRIGDFSAEISAENYAKIKEKINEAGGINSFLEKLYV